MTLDFSEDNVIWVASKLSGAAGALGEGAIELKNWILRFGCASKKMRFAVAGIADWLEKSYPSLAVYRALMSCRIVTLDKILGFLPVGIWKTLRRDLSK